MWFYDVRLPTDYIYKSQFSVITIHESLTHVLKLQEMFPSLANTLLRSHLGLWSWESYHQQFGLFMPMAHLTPWCCPCFPCLAQVIGPYLYYWVLAQTDFVLYCSLKQPEFWQKELRGNTPCRFYFHLCTWLAMWPWEDTFFILHDLSLFYCSMRKFGLKDKAPQRLRERTASMHTFSLFSLSKILDFCIKLCLKRVWSPKKELSNVWTRRLPNSILNSVI